MKIYVAKGINIACRTINGEAFIYDQETRKLYKLDEVGSFIWDQIYGIITIENISDTCCKTFEGDEQDIRPSIEEFINTLYNKKLVVLSNEIFSKEVISVC